MEISRRAFLAALVTLPLVGRLIPKPATDVSYSPADSGYREYMRAQLQGIASSLGTPYETISTELSQADYSAYLTGIEDARRIKAIMTLFLARTQ